MTSMEQHRCARGEAACPAVGQRVTLRLQLPDATALDSAELVGRILVSHNTANFSRQDPRVRFPHAL